MSLWLSQNHEKVFFVCYLFFTNDGLRPFLCDASNSKDSLARTSPRTQECCLPEGGEHAKQIAGLAMSAVVEFESPGACHGDHLHHVLRFGRA